jgi:hypothetical protein
MAPQIPTWSWMASERSSASSTATALDQCALQLVNPGGER